MPLSEIVSKELLAYSKTDFGSCENSLYANATTNNGDYRRGIDEGDREDMEIGMREDRAEDQSREHNSGNMPAEGGLQSAGDMKRRRDLYTELLWDRFQSRPRPELYQNANT
ncbi:hypothetical protein L198_06741 [Cryptococcus wingfieldii CBS 7118]|uniref:Uncharacterized protein n=1 Tax=Cryptococcus wingfieldii CBS 7118 TaxID=1295528 RepID=A0A1E3IIP5_9TREE|nr:hypothetical protein L198_06741 [Cryptococcus wingfieldii CBS 7118]ODN88469.1 hypothetical protein L198_06741 [Cryptococcus wingfieldii CBS 7118]